MEKAQALGQTDLVLIPPTRCHVTVGKSFTSLSLSCHLEQHAKDADTCVTGWCWEGLAQGWGLPRGTLGETWPAGRMVGMWQVGRAG